MSTIVSRQITEEIKEIINKKDLSLLQIYWMDLQNTEFPCIIDWTTLFQKLYLHACNKGCVDITIWFEKVLFEQLDPIQKIGLRQNWFERKLATNKQTKKSPTSLTNKQISHLKNKTLNPKP
jgi:hypothetical protein